MELIIPVVIEVDDNESFYAHCPGFPGIHIDGRTKEEAYSRACEALEWYLGSLQKAGEPIPKIPKFDLPPNALLKEATLECFRRQPGISSGP